MPFVEVHVYGKTLRPEQKEQLFHDVDDVLKRVLGAKDGQVRIHLREEPASENYFNGSASKSDRI